MFYSEVFNFFFCRAFSAAMHTIISLNLQAQFRRMLINTRRATANKSADHGSKYLLLHLLRIPDFGAPLSNQEKNDGCQHVIEVGVICYHQMHFWNCAKNTQIFALQLTMHTKSDINCAIS